MIRAILIYITFVSFTGFSQTYEIIEIDIECTPKPVEGLNTKGMDFSPFVSGETFYFTSSREFDLFSFGENNWKNAGFLNIYQGKVKAEDGEMKIKNIEIISNKFITDNHTGPLCLSASGDTMFFTQVREVAKKDRKKKEKFRPQLYMSVREGKVWQDPTPLPFNNLEYSFGHPSYDSQNGRLYFASDMLGGKGGKDIYFSDLKDGVWSTPENMAEINTSSNEYFPCVTDGYIFFSSDRSGGSGAMDIYWKPLKDKLANPTALKGISSPEDDFGIFVYPGMEKGFYSNNSGGDDDIIYFDMEKKVTIKNALAGKFTYRNIQGTASGLKIQVLSEDDKIILETTTNDNGEFMFNNIAYEGNYRIEAVTEEDLYLTIYDKDGNPVTYLVSDENGSFSYKKIGYDKGGTLALLPDDMIDFKLNQGHLSGQFVYENFPGKYPNQLKVMLTNEKGESKFETFTDANGNFDFKKLSMDENYILTVPGNKDELILLIFDKKGNVVAQLKSDPKGDFTYRKLKPTYSNSLKVIEEDEDMFELETKTVSGYFEYKNIANKFENGLKVQAYSEDGFLLEETVTDENGKFRFRSLPLDMNLLFKMDDGDENLQLDDFTLYIYDRNGKKIAQLRKGQNDYFIYKPLGFDIGNHLTTIKEDTLEHISIDTKYDLTVVYFDSNKSNVKSNDLSKLNKLYSELKANPSLKIEVNAYADAKNSDEYNLILSGQRGDWVVDYLIKKGIPKSRFIVNAYGESQLIDENNDALNRRAEIRIY